MTARVRLFAGLVLFVGALGGFLTGRGVEGKSACREEQAG